MCASAIQAMSCKCLQREELCVKTGIGVSVCVCVCRYAKEVRRWKFSVHCVASSPLIHVGMCRMIGARSIAEREFSFAALK